MPKRPFAVCGYPGGYDNPDRLEMKLIAGILAFRIA